MVNKMKFNNALFFLTLLLINYYPNIVNAASKSIDLMLSVGPINNIASDSAIANGKLITGTWNTERTQPYFCLDTDNRLDKETIYSVRDVSGTQTRYERENYDVFKTTHSGVGWIMAVSNNERLKWLPIVSNKEVQVFPYTGGGSDTVGVGATVKFALVKIPGRFPNGIVTLPAQELAKVNCYRYGQLIETATIRLNPVTMEFKARSCRVQTGTQTLQMGSYTRQTFSRLSIGENLEAGKTANISLICEKDVAPFVTISDNNNIGNETNIISLKSPNAATTAKGVGYQVFFNNILQSLGPKSESEGNKNQFRINDTTTLDNQIVSLTLLFKYVKTNNTVVAGEANASVTLTFSYQ
ncbi:fimbrial adhesin [Proteus vulgaris]|nr:fimbrial adhesin [Proteus vulgaris]